MASTPRNLGGSYPHIATTTNLYPFDLTAKYSATTTPTKTDTTFLQRISLRQQRFIATGIVVTLLGSYLYTELVSPAIFGDEGQIEQQLPDHLKKIYDRQHGRQTQEMPWQSQTPRLPWEKR
jgi:hypothetical protein